MDNFKDYIYYLLWTPLKKVEKEKNAWYKLAKVYGSLFDRAKEALLTAREETMVATCSPFVLQVHADDRRLTKYAGETDENYRRRIASYPEVCRLGGTNPGIMLAVSSLGFKNHYIALAKDLFNDPERWAEFYLILPFSSDEAWPVGISILRKVVRDTKETGAKDNYLFKLSGKATNQFGTESSLMIINRCYPRPNQPLLLLDGNWYLDGTYELSDFMTTSLEDYPLYLDGSWELAGYFRLNGYQLDQHLDLYPLSVTSVTESSVSVETKTILTVEKDLWYLDGTNLLDGTRSLASDIFQYDM